MKRKYEGMLTMGLIVVALLLTGIYYQSGAWRTVALEQGRVPPAGSSSWTPSPRQMSTVQTLADELPYLAFPASQRKDTMPLRLFGEYSMDAGGQMAEAESGGHEVNYGLSLTVLAGPVRFCVIDGQLLAEGEKLSDGAQVVRIAAQKVLIAKESAMKWLLIEDAPISTEKMFYSHADPRKGPS